MYSNLKTFIFLLLMAFAIGFLWLEARQNARQILWNGAVVVPVVLLSLLFTNRFSGARKRAATIMVESAFVALLAAAIAAWKFLLLWSGYGLKTNDLIEGVAASVLFFMCLGGAVWSFLRLRRLGKIQSPA
jgi:hypothetical protein